MKLPALPEGRSGCDEHHEASNSVHTRILSPAVVRKGVVFFILIAADAFAGCGAGLTTRLAVPMVGRGTKTSQKGIRMADPVAPAPAAPLKKTALNTTHRALKAKMVDFGGWDMPVEYPGAGGGLIAEHMAVRTAVGLFDVSHMGEIQFRGPGTLAAVQHITMNDAARLKDGQAQYSALLTPQGTFVDDILVHRLSAERLSARGERGNHRQGLRLDPAAGWQLA